MNSLSETALSAEDQASEYVSFTPPGGGLAVWVHFREDIPIKQIRVHTLKLVLLSYLHFLGNS